MQREGERFELGASDEQFSSSETRPVANQEDTVQSPPRAPFSPVEIGPAPELSSQKPTLETPIKAESTAQFLEKEIDGNVPVNSLSDLEDRVGQLMDSGI